MEQTTMIIDTMDDVRREIDNCQRKAMTSVVELGYILRKADDAGIYKEQGYTSIFTFAKEEYGWSQSQTSRFMDINREFSEGGYSTILKEQYKGFGQAKLAEMLTLPENIREELDPGMKRNEIRKVKREIQQAEREEKENTFEEAVFSGGQEGGMKAAVEKLFSLPDMAKKLPRLYPYMKRAAEGETVPEEDIRTAISSTGFGTVRAGGTMFFWKKDRITTIKGNQKGGFSYKELLGMVNLLASPEGKTLEEWYRNVYGKDIPGIQTEHQPQPEKEPAGITAPENPHAEKEEKQTGVNTAPGIETSTNGRESGKEEGTELSGQTETRESTGRMEAGRHIEQEKAAGEKTGNKPVPGIETSTKREESRQTGAGAVTGQHDAGGCHYCSGKEKIRSNDGQFFLHLHENGLARIGYKSVSAVMELTFCPACGKELEHEK